MILSINFFTQLNDKVHSTQACMHFCGFSNFKRLNIKHILGVNLLTFQGHVTLQSVQISLRTSMQNAQLETSPHLPISSTLKEEGL